MQREVASLALTPFPTLAFRPFPAPSLLPSPASPRPAEWDGVGEQHGGGRTGGGRGARAGGENAAVQGHGKRAGEGKRGGGGAGGKRAKWVGSDLSEKKTIAGEPRGEGETRR